MPWESSDDEEGPFGRVVPQSKENIAEEATAMESRIRQFCSTACIPVTHGIDPQIALYRLGGLESTPRLHRPNASVLHQNAHCLEGSSRTDR